ncbi:MAG: histidine phosphatase family protein [Gammaproteobacteria bacterium]|jgi:2,3-bisphosphoglycerate-dependent phosphoglycerate mutase|nr:histidine phosphatase family protein [Gammaproteobacteria bacterium]MDH5239161.1 histidine phosphatase family protein [Gammaproteobacteria bacterium]MDH5260332.1 histidine phosphatase family protein [Gammaproteobacteria bacterium]MDH5582605.1 histidine phosphatase family protein [Gammaproteobacteria bacterium]
MSKTMSEADRRRRRRRRRIQVITIYMAIAVGLAWFFESQATTTVIFVRHAEKMAEPSDDPGLSEAGLQRAAELARQLVDADVVAGVDAIYSTSYRRTEETARPVADALSLPITSYDASNTATIMDEIVKKHKGKIILVVGHSNTIPALIGNMGASKKVPEIKEDEYDNIYIVSIPWFGKTKTIRLRYGMPYVPAE